MIRSLEVIGIALFVANAAFVGWGILFARRRNLITEPPHPPLHRSVSQRRRMLRLVKT